MDYKRSVEYLFQRLPMYQRSGIAAFKKDIGNIIKACKILNNPEKKIKTIHIAGTNGKGSTAHMLASILQEAGYKTGLYTSPHLKDFRERIKINGKTIDKKYIINFIKENQLEFEKINMSFFEFTVAMAFNYFTESKVDIAIIETGLGGRLDSTNIINPELSIITNIGLDHTNLLGNTIEKIAFEKAGIIKKNTPIIIGRKQHKTKEIFKSIAKEKNAKLYYNDNPKNIITDVKGDYQNENIGTAIKAIEVLNWNISNEQINKGINNILKNTGLEGRWQKLSENPLTICDVGHNEDGIKNILRQIEKTKFNKLHFIFGSVNDKVLTNIFKLLPKKAKYYFCAAKIDRALQTNILKQRAEEFNLYGDEFSSVNQAYINAKENASKDDLIFIGGSAFIVAEVL
jgi:dihydrofolate synthase/folylpolyglutamate synthase